jgi:hypothetical protein
VFCSKQFPAIETVMRSVDFKLGMNQDVDAKLASVVIIIDHQNASRWILWSEECLWGQLFARQGVIVLNQIHNNQL